MARHGINKKFKKLSDKKCFFCECDNYNLLDVHRIVPGSNGGSYSLWNVLCLCCSCHRLVHSGKIIIDKKYHSTSGRGCVLHYFIDGMEFWKDC